ncbi:hypothetical protein DFH06DRAFT_508892 [Mycena polygramma]|nr:hypothetical protein DFH06DRAFT_508892 [Mycena polygramma]
MQDQSSGRPVFFTTCRLLSLLAATSRKIHRPHHSKTRWPKLWMKTVRSASCSKAVIPEVMAEQRHPHPHLSTRARLPAGDGLWISPRRRFCRHSRRPHCWDKPQQQEYKNAQDRRLSVDKSWTRIPELLKFFDENTTFVLSGLTLRCRRSQADTSPRRRHGSKCAGDSTSGAIACSCVRNPKAHRENVPTARRRCWGRAGEVVLSGWAHFPAHQRVARTSQSYRRAVAVLLK